jgi:hypothetical protein
MENISAHISYKEATISPTAVRLGIKNTPDEMQLKRMKLVAEKCFEPIRANYAKPINVTSFFRSALLNKAIGGSSTTSQHMQGEAIDFVCENMKDLFAWIRKNVEFDQLIWEYGDDNEPDWIHISYTEQRHNRQQVLRVKRVDGKMVWTVL